MQALCWIHIPFRTRLVSDVLALNTFCDICRPSTGFSASHLHQSNVITIFPLQILQNRIKKLKRKTTDNAESFRQLHKCLKLPCWHEHCTPHMASQKNPNNWCSTDMIWSYYLARAVKKKFAGRWQKMQRVPSNSRYCEAWLPAYKTAANPQSVKGTGC